MLQRDNVVERSASGGLILRFDNVLLMRGGRGTWLLDLQVQVGDAQRRLQVPIGRHKVFDRFASEILNVERDRDQAMEQTPSA
ncbi:MAG: hypothetical protein ABSC35_12640 [Candidatus Dormibacteria bacterium]|jgi:hypothetical protein